MNSDQVTIRNSAIDNRSVGKIFQVFTHSGIEIGSEKIDYKELKRSYKHMWPLPNQSLSISNEGLSLGQDVFSLIRPLDTSQVDLVTPGQYELCWVGLQVDHCPQK